MSDINPNNQASASESSHQSESQAQEVTLQPIKKKGLFSFLGKSNPPNTSSNPGVVAQQKIKKGPPVLLLVVIVLVLILGGLLAVLLARGGGDEYVEPTDTEGEVVWWGFEDSEIYQPLIEEFEENNPNRKVIYQQQSTENYRERLTNSLASGKGPDMFTFHNSWVPSFRSELDRIPSFVMSPEEFSEIYYPVAVADLETSEGIVGLPLEYDGLALYINEDIFTTAGKTPPETWDEIKSLARELTQRNDRGIIIQSGAALGHTENIDHWQEIIAFMMFQNHGTPSNPGSNESRDALSYYRQFKTDLIWNQTLPPSTIAFGNGDVAMYFGTVESASAILKRNPNLRFRTVTLPQLRRNDPTEPDISYASYWVQGVWKRSENRGVAWSFLEFMSRRDSLNKIYENAERVKLIGDPYPRRDMASLIQSDRISGSVIALAPNARSWYLADKTYDGESGINSQFDAIYERVINGGDLSNLGKITTEIRTLLARYGLLNN